MQKASPLIFFFFFFPQVLWDFSVPHCLLCETVILFVCLFSIKSFCSISHSQKPGIKISGLGFCTQIQPQRICSQRKQDKKVKSFASWLDVLSPFRNTIGVSVSWKIDRLVVEYVSKTWKIIDHNSYLLT